MQITTARLHAVLVKRSSNAFCSHQRRAARARQVLDYSLEDLRHYVRLALDGGACPYCAGPLTPLTFSCDHLTPVGRGGSFALANVEVCCSPCNRAKGPLTEEEFAQLLQLLATWPPVARTNVLARLRAGGKMVRGL